MSLTEAYNNVAAVILSVAGLVAATYGLIVHKTKVKAWRKRRQKRREVLDNLIDNAEQLQCGTNQLTDLTASMTTLTDKVDKVTATLNRTIKHNARQDREIMRSLQQREAHDLALYALLDVAKREGNNGPVTEAHQKMTAWMQKESHRPYETEKEDISD